MNTAYRYILTSNKIKKLDCSFCGAKKHWQRYIDIKTNEVLPEKYGRCDNSNKCGKWVMPKDSGYTLQKNTSEPLKKNELIHIFSNTSIDIDYTEKYFTEITPFTKGDSSNGILFYYTIKELQTRLNKYASNGNKNANPAILKGIFKNGTSGEFCKVPAPFLFFDIDVKETENPDLLNFELNNKVFELLKDFCLLVWRSNSRTGIAGIIHFPQLSLIGIDEIEKHLNIAKQTYKYLSDYIFHNTNIKVVFDNQQGKFRQIRYLAEQEQQRIINLNSKCLRFQILPFVPIPDYTFKKTLEPERYERNIFIQNLLRNVPFPFETDDVTKVIELYRLGTIANGYRAESITFPFIDIQNNVRAIQVKQFNKQNHTTGTDFLHSIIEKHLIRNNQPLPKWLEEYIKQDKRISCLFGEHLLNKYPNAKIFLFEAPKTAIYNTLHFGFPEQSNIISLAVYNKSSFSFDKVKVLKGRSVYVFPDLSKDGKTFDEWQTKAKDYEKKLTGTRFIFSDLLEKLASEQDKENGNDLADFLIKHDWRLFRKQLPENELITHKKETKNENDRIREVTREIAELEDRVTETKGINQRLEQSFNEIAKQIDFYEIAPKHIKEPKGEQAKIKELIYWIT